MKPIWKIKSETWWTLFCTVNTKQYNKLYIKFLLNFSVDFKIFLNPWLYKTSECNNKFYYFLILKYLI